MKKFNLLAAIILVLAVSFIAPQHANAQRPEIITPTKDSCVATDTALVSFGTVEGTAVAFHVLIPKDTGTVAGKVVFYGQAYSTNYKTALDSTTLGNKAYQDIFYMPARLGFESYEAKVFTTGGKVKRFKGEIVHRRNRVN